MPRPTKSSDRKALQFAAQIGRSIEMTLLGEIVDDVLNNLSVEQVEPAPGHRMLVTLVVHEPGASLDKQEVLDRLEAQRGLLMRHLAQDVNRRSLPTLSFWLVRAPDEPPPPLED